MRIGLGIDTGGTYTDAVIFDFAKDKILSSSKAKTSREDLKLGIIEGLEKLPGDLLKEVGIVSLSTTLATNAAVEDRVGRGTLILIGCDREIVEKYGSEYGLPNSREIIFLEGGHNQQGDVIAEPDWSLLKEKVSQVRYKTDGFAIVQLWGMRNPEFEIKGKRLIHKWTGLPVVCAHELLGDLNFLKRAATALLNVKLIPIINEFLDAIKVSLQEKEITAPLVIVRGDGSLMSEEFARERPLETLLSGPAASVIGGMNLTGKKDCIIIDMGGTTSDFALVKDGQLKLVDGGIDVGVWRTGTKSILLKTIGLGGDSRISFKDNGELLIGPQRVAPLSWLASRWPETLTELRLAAERGDSLCEFYYLLRDTPEGLEFYEQERAVVECLKEGPRTIEGIAGYLNCSVFDLDLKRLEKANIIFRSGLTPTDIMHLRGDFTAWDKEAAALGAKTMAGLLGISLEELISRVERGVKERLYYSIVNLLLENEDEHKFKGDLNGRLKDLIMLGYREPGKDRLNDFINLSFSTEIELIGIGAPIHVYLPDVAEMLGTRCTIPEKAAVANAVGAITGNISLMEEVKIRPRFEATVIRGYDCYSSEGKKEFQKYKEALEWAREEALRLARKNAAARGAGEVKTFIDVKEKDVTPKIGSLEPEVENKDKVRKKKGTLLLETVVTARAVGTFRDRPVVSEQIPGR